MSHHTDARRILAAATGQLWAMHHPKVLEVQAFLQAVAAGERRTPAQARALFGAARSTAPMKAGQVAVLPLLGTVCHRANSLYAYSGGTSTEQFAAAFDAALAHEDVAHIVIDGDSPGGPTTGVEELSARIRKGREKKPVTTVCNGILASGGYWIGAQANEVVVTPSGMIGGQGVYAMHVEVSELEAREGVKWTLIASDPRKVEGNSHEPLSGPALEHQQHMVMETNDLFVAAVAKGRGVSEDEVREDFGGGRVFTAKRAVKLGIADRVASLEEVLAGLGVKRSSPPVPGRRAAHAAPALAADAGGLAVLGEDAGALDLSAGWNEEWEPLQAHRPRIMIPGAVFSAPGVAAALFAAEDAGDKPEACEDCGAELLPDGDGFRCPECEPEVQDEPEAAAAESEQVPQADAGGAAPTVEPTPAPSPAAKAKETTVDPITEPQAGAGTQQQPENPLATAQSIVTLAQSHGMPAAEAQALAFSGISEAQAAQRILAWKGERTAAVGTTAPHVSVGADREAERPFPSLGAQLLCIAEAETGTPDKRLLHLRHQAMQAAAAGGNTYVPSEGGWPVQATYAGEIMKHVWEEDEILKRCNIIPLGAGTDAYVRWRLRQKSRKAGYRFGGVRVYRTKEAKSVEASKPDWAADRLPLETLMGIMYATREQLRSAPQLNAEAEKMFPLAIRFQQTYETFWGSGAGEGFGFMLHGDLLIVIAKTAAQAAATFSTANALAMLAALPAECFGTAAWYIHRTVIPQLGALTIGNYPVFTASGNVTGPLLGTLYGRPVIVSEFCKPLGEKGDVVLADLNTYDIIHGGETQQDVSLHVRFTTNEQAFRIVADTNGQPRWAESVEDLHGTGKTSPFVVLEERA